MILSTTVLFALETKISPSIVYEGDKVSFVISAQGDEVKFPKLENIAGLKVETQAISRNITNINGKITKTLSKEYTFTAQKDFTIPQITVEVDGKSEKTNALAVEVRKERVGSNPSFMFALTSDKKEVYMGEPVNVLFTFKKHIDVELAEANFNSPTFHDFWAKPTAKQPAVIEGDYMVYRIRYLLFAQKSGKIKIEPGRMDAGIMQKRTRDFFSFERIKWKSVFSNDLTIKVNPLPQGVGIYGNFTLEAEIDKQKTKANEPVNLTVTIKGIGNVDDIEEFKLDIKDAIVYADKPERKIYTNEKEELGEFTQKFAIVSDRNFTISPLTFTFFDSREKQVKNLKSQQYTIEVEGAMIKTQTAKLEKKSSSDSQTKAVETKIIYDKVSQTILTLFTLGGFLIGFLTAFLLFKKELLKNTDQKQEQPLIKRIKKSKSDKELLSLLLPYAHRSKKMQSLINLLEENVYEAKMHHIDKKMLIKDLEVYLEKDKEIEDILR